MKDLKERLLKFVLDLKIAMIICLWTTAPLATIITWRHNSGFTGLLIIVGYVSLTVFACSKTVKKEECGIGTIVICVMWNLWTWDQLISILGTIFSLPLTFAFLISYWCLFYLKQRKAETDPDTEDETPPITMHSKNDDEEISQKKYARIPFLRIPMPWLKYKLTINENRKQIERISWFGSYDKDSDTCDGETLVTLNSISAFTFSGVAFQKISGTAVFYFLSADKKWHHWCIPIALKETLKNELSKK